MPTVEVNQHPVIEWRGYWHDMGIPPADVAIAALWDSECEVCDGSGWLPAPDGYSYECGVCGGRGQ